MEKYAFIGTKEDYHIIQPICSVKNLFWLDISKSYTEIIQQIEGDEYICLLVKKKDNYLANRILWDCKSIIEVKIIDSNNPYEIESKKGKMSNKKLWDFISVNACSQIEEGGFYHCFNNEPFSQDEVREFADNVYIKLKDYLDNNKTVLEIGCASGITMSRLLPYSKFYFGIDMASVSVKKNKVRAKEQNIDNVEFIQCEANKIADLSIPKIDIVIINSVVQYFPGINYLLDVVLQSVSLLREEGIIYIGDVLDLKKQKDLVEAALLYKKIHPDADTRLDYSDELFLSREYFQYLASKVDGIYKVEITDKIGSIVNEMLNFRYDVTMHYKQGSKKIAYCSGKSQSAEKMI